MQTNTATVPTEAMRTRRLQRAARPGNPFFSTPQIIRDPLTGQPFPDNVIPANRLSPNGVGAHERLSAADAGLPAGHRQRDHQQREPAGSAEGQHPVRLPAERRTTSSPTATRKYNWVAVDAFRGTFPFARTDWDRPNTTQNVSWTSTLSNNLINEFSYTYSLDQVFINVFTESGLYKRSRTGINYPYIFPDSKEIEDKIPTITIDTFTEHRRRPVSLVVAGADPRVLERDDLRQGPPHVQGRHRHRVLGRGRLRPDQRQRDSRRHQQPERPVRVPQQRDRRAPGVGMADMALGLFTQLRRDRPARVHEVARARDRHLRAGFVEADAAT